MTSNTSYANFEAKEGTAIGAVELAFNLKPRKIIITNDSSTKDLSFKFNSTETFGTLSPTETVSLEVSSKTVFLSGDTVAYRVWGMG